MTPESGAPPEVTTSASRVVVYEVAVEFGDCDPAGIVWFPNFFRWVDAASRHFFRQCGVPPWKETTLTHGIIGTPLLDTKARFVRPASYDDRVAIHTSVPHWGDKRFTMSYRLMRDDVLLAEIEETRAFCRRHPDDPKRIQAVAVPTEFRALCEIG